MNAYRVPLLQSLHGFLSEKNLGLEEVCVDSGRCRLL